MPTKQRLDSLVFERQLAPSRELARRYIMAGEVRVNGQVVDKPGTLVAADADVSVEGQARFVSRGGEKLAAALEAFGVVVDGQVCADVGASTGGFTDCLLQYGASKVYAIDVGYGQLAHKLRIDPRVAVLERTNARNLAALPETVDVVVMDVSFISLRLLFPAMRSWLKPQANVVPLIKPQFEAGREDVGKGGVVKDPAVHRRVLLEVLTAAQSWDLQAHGLIRSPIQGAKEGNTEFLAWLRWGTGQPGPVIEALVETVLPPDAS
ncbi:MAG: TlyA family RNA methyltransferase [Anaerolineae bacterium]|nr:TlyA family RNA methyltransferase [Anaerolineae bacterium]